MGRHRIAVATGATALYLYDTDDPAEARARARAYLQRRVLEFQSQLDQADRWTSVCWPPSACSHNRCCPQAPATADKEN